MENRKREFYQIVISNGITKNTDSKQVSMKNFIYLGGDVTVYADDVIGIFDIEECSVSRTTAEYLNFCQKKGIVVNVSDNLTDIPKSFIVCEKKTYISNVSNTTINKRGRKKMSQK